MKAMLKRVVPSNVWDRARTRREKRLWIAQERYVRKVTANTVVAGPFRGLKLGAEKSWGNASPMLLGCYESELHLVIERAIENEPQVVVDVGCAEGYYAIGFARRLPGATVYAFDIDPRARSICAYNAERNEVGAQLIIGSECRLEDLERLSGSKSLFVLDCEGAELELLNPQKVPGLAVTPVLVELHDFIDSKIEPTMRDRFAPTHSIETLVSAPHDYRQVPLLSGIDPRLGPMAVDERRPVEPHPMRWMYMTPNQQPASA